MTLGVKGFGLASGDLVKVVVGNSYVPTGTIGLISQYVSERAELKLVGYEDTTIHPHQVELVAYSRGGM
jgi:hypothetical protein